MTDIGIKDGHSTLFLTEFELTDFIARARSLGLNTAIAGTIKAIAGTIKAIAGTIKFEDIPTLKRIQPDM